MRDGIHPMGGIHDTPHHSTTSAARRSLSFENCGETSRTHPRRNPRPPRQLHCPIVPHARHCPSAFAPRRRLHPQMLAAALANIASSSASAAAPTGTPTRSFARRPGSSLPQHSLEFLRVGCCMHARARARSCAVRAVAVRWQDQRRSGATICICDAHTYSQLVGPNVPAGTHSSHTAAVARRKQPRFASRGAAAGTGSLRLVREVDNRHGRHEQLPLRHHALRQTDGWHIGQDPAE